MEKTNELHDWSAYLIRAEKLMRHINDGLLHRNYKDVEENVLQIKSYLDKTVAWVHEQDEQ